MLVVNLQLGRFNGPNFTRPIIARRQKVEPPQNVGTRSIRRRSRVASRKLPTGSGELKFKSDTFERSKILRRDIAKHQTRTQQIQDLRAACPPTARKTSARDAHARKRLFVQREMTHKHAHPPADRLTKCVYKMQIRTFFQRHTHIHQCARRDTRAAQRGGLCAHLHNVAKTKRRQHQHTIVQNNTHTLTHTLSRTHVPTCKNTKTQSTSAYADARVRKNNVPILNWKTSRKNLSAAVFTLSSAEPLGPSSTETKRMIEHQSPTVTQRDSILRQKQRR